MIISLLLDYRCWITAGHFDSLLPPLTVRRESPPRRRGRPHGGGAVAWLSQTNSLQGAQL